MKILLKCFLVANLIMYYVYTIVTWQLNPSYWTIPQRHGFVGFVILLTLFFGFLYLVSIDPD
jgi:hypothetical protein